MTDLPPMDPGLYDRLLPGEKRLVDRQPGTPWQHAQVERRLGDPEYDSTRPGYMVRLRCRFCVALDGVSNTSTDLGRIGFTSKAQYAEHLQLAHCDPSTPVEEADLYE